MANNSPAERRRPWKEVIRNFTPAWFAVTMGTGAICSLFHSFPYGADTQGMKIMTFIFFFLNLFLFVLFTAVSIVRYVAYPDIWSIMIRHPVQSLYLGTFPMGATTIINIAVTVINSEYNFGGKGFLYAMWAMWWLDVIISAACCWGLVHFMHTSQTHSLEKMTSVWLLPVVTFIVASSSGGVIAPVLKQYSLNHALLTVTISVFMVAIGLSLALMMLTVYLLRLIVYGLPPAATIISVFLPLGPTGQAGFAILLAGQFYQSVLPLSYGSSELLRSSATGETLNVICVCIAFVLWSLASMWLVFALLGIHDVLRRTRLKFRVPFWGLIFPNGVYANLTINLYHTFNSPFFRVWGAIYAAATLFMWLWAAYETGIYVWTRDIFEAPCLQDLDLGTPGLQKPNQLLSNGTGSSSDAVNLKAE